MYSRFLDMRDRMLDHAGKAVLRNGFVVFAAVTASSAASMIPVPFSAEISTTLQPS